MTWASDETTMRAQADAQTREMLGPFPDEPGFDPEDWDFDPDEAFGRMRLLSNQIYEGALQADNMLWGLAIAGVYHRWECEVKRLLQSVVKPEARKLRKANFDEILDFVALSGFPICGGPLHEKLLDVSLVANAVKHGEGHPRDMLKNRRSDLFVRDGKKVELRINVVEFDKSTVVIDEFWEAYERSFVSTHQRGKPTIGR